MFKPHFQIFLLFCRLCQPGHIAGISRFFQRDFLAEFEGSDAKKQARIYLTTFGIDYDAITKEQFVNLVDVLKLSKHMKSLTNQRGRARPYQPHGIGFHVIGLTPSYEHPANGRELFCQAISQMIRGRLLIIPAASGQRPGRSPRTPGCRPSGGGWHPPRPR